MKRTMWKKGRTSTGDEAFRATKIGAQNLFVFSVLRISGMLAPVIMKVREVPRSPSTLCKISSIWRSLFSYTWIYFLIWKIWRICFTSNSQSGFCITASKKDANLEPFRRFFATLPSSSISLVTNAICWDKGCRKARLVQILDSKTGRAKLRCV